MIVVPEGKRRGSVPLVVIVIVCVVVLVVTVVGMGCVMFGRRRER